jgi:uncharacterized membrane protein YgcG
MARLTPWMLIPALFGWLLAAQPVEAQTRSEYVTDDARFFSNDAKAKANADIARMRSRFKKELVVETVVSVTLPAEIKADDKAAVNRFFDQWAEKRFAQEKVDGVYVVITQNPAKERIQVGNRTGQGLFTDADRRELDSQLIANLKAAHAEQMKNQAKNDRVLLDAVNFVAERMSRHAGQVAGQRQTPAQAPTGQAPQGGQQGTPWGTYILIGIGVFLVIWLIMGIVRAFSGAGAGASPGMAGAGGGGGGFFSSLLGGLFGAAAGMWLYNSVFGGHTSSAWGAGPDGGQGTGSGPDTSSSGGGGDYDSGGADAGGGDWGGGGGEWGGGGDFGGGGDGGGGDW